APRTTLAATPPATMTPADRESVPLLPRSPPRTLTSRPICTSVPPKAVNVARSGPWASAEAARPSDAAAAMTTRDLIRHRALGREHGGRPYATSTVEVNEKMSGQRSDA